tara:strand:+ start:235 stop:819 length:585 start_codon:yes stop_codon:yes gene_type:complete
MEKIHLKNIIKEEIQKIFEEEEKKQLKVYLKDLETSIKGKKEFSSEEVIKHFKKLEILKPQVEKKIELIKKRLKTTKDGNWVQKTGIPMKKSSLSQLKRIEKLIKIFSEKKEELGSEVSDVNVDKVNKYLRAIYAFKDKNKVKNQMLNIKQVINAADLDINLKKANEILDQIQTLPNIDKIKEHIKKLITIINK